MPGNIINAICPCGYAQILEPGVFSDIINQKNVLQVIAYDDQKNILITIDSNLANNRKLEVIEDPFATYGFSEDTYRCPSCEKNALILERGGLWD